MRKCIFILLAIGFNLSVYAQNNAIQTFTSANGLGNSGCSDVLFEPNGTLWVGHNFYGQPTLNNKPFSRRLPTGTWDYPFSTLGLPIVTVGGYPYSWTSFSVKKIYRTSNGAIWFIPNAANATDMNLAPPILVYHNSSFTVRHISLNNFPNKGAVHDMVQDSYGHIWFGCQEGLIKLDANSGNYSTYNPPNIPGVNNSKRVFDLDYDVNNRLLMLTGYPQTVLGAASVLRIFTESSNTWEYWSLIDASWINASQVSYAPYDIKATRDSINRVYLSTDGGGIYWIDNSNWGSKQRNQIANFLQGWSAPGFTFPNIFTNLPNFTMNLYKDKRDEIWIFGSLGHNVHAYKHMFKYPTNYGAGGATYHMYGFKESQHLYNNNGTITKSRYTGMAFGHGDEVWLSSEHGLERWYYDTMSVAGDFIGLQGVGPNKEGVIGFNTKSNNVLEPAGTGHKMPTTWPGISIDTAYYYLSSSDYEGIVAGVNAGIKGNGHYNGFSQTAAALAAANKTFDNIKLRFSAIHLGYDKFNTDWTYADSLENRFYKGWHQVNNNNNVTPMSYYEILLDNQVLFKELMPDFQLSIKYNKYGYLFDSIGGLTEYVQPTPNPNISDPTALSIRNAMQNDFGGNGIRFIFQTIQPALNEEIQTAERRGGIFEIYNAFLQKGSTPAAPPPPTPMCGIYTIGQTANADYPNFTAAIADLHLRGIICNVTFQVGKGSYNERLNLGEVDGMHLYTITFDGGDANPEVSFSPAVNDSNYVFAIAATQNLVIKNLKFRNISSSHGKVFQLTGATKNFKMENCELEGFNNAPTTPVATKNRFILLTCADCDSSQFLNNKMYHGSDGFSIAGTRVVIKNNEFQGNKSYAMVLSSATDIEVIKNRILGTTAGNFSGIFFGGHPFKVNNNQILNTTANCLNAIYSFDNGVGNAASPSQVFNNEISVNSNSGFGTGISISCGHVQIYHNSIHILGNNANFHSLQNFHAPAGWTARNNIVVNFAGKCFYTSKPTAGSSFADSDYNIFFSNAATPFQTQIEWGTDNNINTLAAFQTATGREANSLFINPEFSDNNHLLPLNALANNLGAHLPNLTTDILGRQRPAANRDHGCYEFDGAGWIGAVNNDWQNPANWSNNQVPTINTKVFISPKANNPVIDTIVKVKEFIMHHQAGLTIEADAGLEVDSLLDNQGLITLASTTTGEYARLIQGEVSGNGRIQQEAALFAANNNLRWYHIGVPVVTQVKDLANPGSIITAGQSGSSIYFWDASTGNWISPPDTAASLQPGIGYAVAAGQNAFGNFLVNGFPNKIDVTGDLRSATQPYVLNLGYTHVPNFNTYVSGLSDGWNLLANPYHAVYDMSGQTIAGPYKMIYVWDGTTYKQYNTDLNVGDLSARYLAPLQGFFVRIDSNMAAQGFSFQPSQRVLDRNDQVLKSQQTYPNFQIEITSTSNSQKDQTYFMAHPMATQAFEEEYDAVKLKNAEEHLNLFTYASGDKMAINVLTETQLEQGVRMGMEAPMEGQFTLSLAHAADAPYEVYVKDDFLKQTIRLDVQDYTFEHKNHYPENRFEVFTKAKTVGIEEHEKLAIYLHTQQGILTLYNLPEQKLQVQILDLQGRVLMQSNKAPHERQHSLTLPQNLAAGVYLVQIPELRKTFKVLID